MRQYAIIILELLAAIFRGSWDGRYGKSRVRSSTTGQILHWGDGETVYDGEGNPFGGKGFGGERAVATRGLQTADETRSSAAEGGEEGGEEGGDGGVEGKDGIAGNDELHPADPRRCLPGPKKGGEGGKGRTAGKPAPWGNYLNGKPPNGGHGGREGREGHGGGTAAGPLGRGDPRNCDPRGMFNGGSNVRATQPPAGPLPPPFAPPDAPPLNSRDGYEAARQRQNPSVSRPYFPPAKMHVAYAKRGEAAFPPELTHQTTQLSVNMQALLRAQEKEARREEAARLRAEEEAEKEAARKKLNGKEGRDGKMATEGEDVTAGGDGQKRVSRALSESASSRSSYSPSTKEAMARELEAKKREELRLYLGESREAFYGGPPKPGQDGEEAREDVAAVHAAPSVQGSQGGRTQSESIALSEGDYYSDYYYSDTASSADATPPRQQTRGLAAAAPQAAADPETGAREFSRGKSLFL